MQKREMVFAAAMFMHHRQFSPDQQAFLDHAFQHSRTHDAKLDAAGKHLVDRQIVGVCKFQSAQITLNRQALLLHFPAQGQPGHRVFIGGRQRCAAQGREPVQLRLCRRMKKHPAELVAATIALTMNHRQNPGDSVFRLQIDINRRVGENEIDPPFGNGRLDPIKGQPDHDKSSPGKTLVEISRQRPPAPNGLTGAAVTEHSEKHNLAAESDSDSALAPTADKKTSNPRLQTNHGFNFDFTGL